MLTQKEKQYILDITNRMQSLRAFLDAKVLPTPDDFLRWFAILEKYKSIQGNLNNDVSFLATLMAKAFLGAHFEIDDFDAAEKPQGAPGLDIDIQTTDGQRIIGEIKTTHPYKADDLGAQQKAMFVKDFQKLNKEKAAIKFFFVTDGATFELMKKPKYRSQIPGVRIVNLISGEETIHK